jgi:hypothetical protein
MPGCKLSRRSSLLLPFVLAACGGREERVYPPLHYGHLTPLRLNVGAIQIEQRYVPSSASPDVSQLDPMPPVQALRNMGTDRLQAFGSTGQAVFVIQEASLTRQRDNILGSFAVELDVYTADNTRAGFAQARVTRRFTGDLDDLPPTLYDMTKDMMDTMNVEFEFQVRRSLRGWLIPDGAVQAPVQEQPLTPPPPPPPR